ncbi:MAG TPA: hypothetical protein VFK34_03870 [Marmoricola sp.]|nr:hypothetical protein [Marmoricola sp.]
MSPRYDHRGPAVAFVVLFLVAVLVMGNQMLARAVGGTTYLAFDRAPRVLLAVRPAPRAVRPAPAPAVPTLMAAVAAAPHVAGRATGHRVVPPSPRRALQASGEGAVQGPARRPGHRAVHRGRGPHHRGVAHRHARGPLHPSVRHPSAGHPSVAHEAVAHEPAVHRASPPGLVRSVRAHPVARERARPHRVHRPAGHASGWARGHGGRGAGSRHRR